MVVVRWIVTFNSWIRNSCIKGLQKIGQNGIFAGEYDITPVIGAWSEVVDGQVIADGRR